MWIKRYKKECMYVREAEEEPRRILTQTELSKPGTFITRRERHDPEDKS